MATKTKTNFEAVGLTSHMPDVVVITTDAVSLEIMVYVNGSLVFDSDYYPFQGKVNFRDIREIVETAMLEKKLALATLTLTAKETRATGSGSTYTLVSGKKVVFSKMKNPNGSTNFLNSNFLTTRKSVLIPVDGYVNISCYVKANEQGTKGVTIYYTTAEDPDTPRSFLYDLGSAQTGSEEVIIDSFDYDFLKRMVDVHEEVDCKVLYGDYHLGNRHFRFFFTEEQATDHFTFMNAFNVKEAAFLFNTRTVKTEVDRSEAVCGRTTHFYDESAKVKFEVETAPLTYDEALWLNQLLTSRYVTRMVGYLVVQVLISDISSEVVESDKELSRLKFSWQYADGNEYL